MATGIVHIRVDEKIKTKASKALAAMGLTLSDAVRLLLDPASPCRKGDALRGARSQSRDPGTRFEAGERGEVFRAASVAELMADLHADD